VYILSLTGAACKNWSIEQKIGEGGYGEVFMGEWQHQAVAIKRIR
jgi:serine/threonine protein kinase